MNFWLIFYKITLFSARIQIAVKKEGWTNRIPGSLGGGLTRLLNFQSGSGNLAVFKPAGKQLNISIGPGLPKDSREFISRIIPQYSIYMLLKFSGFSA